MSVGESNAKALAERRVKLMNGLAGSDDKAKRLKYSMYCRFGDLAQAIYTDPVKEGLVRGNADAFSVLSDSTVYMWAFTCRGHSEEFKSAAEKYEELRKLFSNIQELQRGIMKIAEWTGKNRQNVSFEEFVRGLSSFKADSIVPLMDDMDKTEEDEEIEIEEDGGYFDDEEFDEDQAANNINEPKKVEETPKESSERIIGAANANDIDPATLDRQIAEAEADLASGGLDSDAEQAVKILINELKQLKNEAMSGPTDIMEVKDEYAGDRAEGISILKEVGASFEFTKREIKALDRAFAAVGYNIREDEDSALTNFVAVRRSDFSATFIFSTLGLVKNKRNTVRDVFLANTGYDNFGEIDGAPFGRQDWWAVECITNNRKFTVAEWPGTALPEYKDLGNLKKIWVGSSLREKHLTMDWLDAQNSFNLIGGKSRSGKTCLSHSLLIQGICGGVLPTFLDWKPEGSDLYKELGFFAVQRDARAWLPQGMQQGLHLLNILDALAWLKSMSLVWVNREIAGKRDFDKNKLATPDDPSLLFVFDEIAAFIGTLSSIRIGKKSEKDMTPQEKATKTVTDFAEATFKGLNACLAACATYGVKFMGITQDIMMSDTVWGDKAWGGDEGKNFRKKMLNTFWGRGTVRGIDCPITEQKERSYVNMGMGRFGFEQNGVGTTFRALRIDNSENPSFPGMDAKAVLTNCMNMVGRELPDNRYSYFESMLNALKSTPGFQTVIAAVHEGFGGGSENGASNNDYTSGAYAAEFKSVNEGNTSVQSSTPVNTGRHVQQNENTVLNNPAAKKVVKDKQLDIERQAREALESQFNDEVASGENAKPQYGNASPLGDMSEADIIRALYNEGTELEDIVRVLVEKRQREATTMAGKGGRTNVFDTTQFKSYSRLNNENSIDCRNAGPGALSWFEKRTLDTPKGAERYIAKTWKSILDNVVANGYKKANITRVSIYGGQMYVNGKILNLNGVIGGYECIRLRDIVSFETLFRQFFMIRELRIDEEMLNVAVMEFGDNAIEQFFSRANRLEAVFIQSENGSTTSFTRNAVQNQVAKRMVEKSKVANDMDLYCATKTTKKWSNNFAGDNIWGLRLAKKSLGNAGKVFMDKNKPSVGKAILYAGTGVVVGTVGTVAWGAVNLIKGIAGLGKMFKK